MSEYKRTRYAPNRVLPIDIWGHISSFCDSENYVNFGRVNKDTNSLYKSCEKKTSLELCLTSKSLFKYALDNGAVFSEDIIEYLAIRDLPDLIKVALSYGFEWDHFCIEAASASHSKNFFRWLRTTDLFWLPENAISFCVYNDDLEMIRFFIDEKIGYPDIHVVDNSKNVEIIEYFKNIECDNMYKMVNSIRSDDLNTFKMVWEHIGVIHERAIFECCYHGSLKILRFLIDMGNYPDRNDILVAIQYSRTNLFYLFEEEIPDFMDEGCATFAYQLGNYESLQVLVDMEVSCKEIYFRELESYEKSLSITM